MRNPLRAPIKRSKNTPHSKIKDILAVLFSNHKNGQENLQHGQMKFHPGTLLCVFQNHERDE